MFLRLFDFLGVAIPDRRKYRITSRITKAEEEWRFTRLKGTFGESDLSGRFTISMPKNRLLLDADLSSRVLDIIDAGPFLGYSPERLDREGGRGAIERVRSEEQTSQLQSLMRNSYAVFCFKKKNNSIVITNT